MKVKIIFALLFTLILWGCKTSQPPEEPLQDQPFELSIQHWFANPDSDSNFTERGIDLIIKIENSDFLITPEYIIFRERKSFPPMITPSDDNGYQIEARIILESSRFTETSERVHQTNRLVYTNRDGVKDYMVITQWKTLPNRYD